MEKLLLVLPVVIPVIFWAAYHYHKDRHLPEPPANLLFCFFLGIGPIEELAKLLPFLLFVIRFKAFDEPLDGIIYASFIGLGYAAAENFHYLDFLTPLEAVARGFASPVVHILFASIWGHWIATAKLSGKTIWFAALSGFTAAALLHGFYDFLVLLEPIAALPIAAGLIFVLWVWRLFLMRRLHRAAVKLSNKPA